MLTLTATCLVPAGCTRRYYRRDADRQVEDILTEKNRYEPWRIENWHVYPDPQARFADPANPDRPPMPFDDPAARCLSPNPQTPGKAGQGNFEGTGYLELMQLWDASNRQDSEANQAPPPASSALPPPTRTSASDTATLRTQERPLRIKLEQASELGLFNSREFQDRREDLYLAALAVTLQRFSFVAQFMLTEQVIREYVGRDLPDAGNRWSARTGAQVSQLFPSGALLLLRFANQLVINMSGPGPRVITPSTISLDIAQPLLQGGGKAVTLEPLTQSERNLLYEIRDYARFRKQFFVAIAAGPGAASPELGASFPQGAFPVALASSGFATVTGYLPTLLQVALFVNQQNNVAELERIITFYRQLQGGGDVSPLQTSQVESQLLDSRQTLLQRQEGVRDSLDRFKLQLGVPTNLPLELDDTPVRPLTKHLQRLREVFEQDRAVEREFRPLAAADPARLRDEFRRRYTELPLVRGTQFQKDTVARWAAWERLGDAALDARLRQVDEERRREANRQAEAESAGQELSAEEQRRLDELNLEVNIGQFEQALRQYLARPWERLFADVPEADRLRRQERLKQEYFRRLFDTFVRVLGTARDERLEQIRTSWPVLPKACVNGVDLLTADLDTAEATVTQVALANRLDLMNARAQLVDAWRDIAVRANSLLGVFSVQYHLDTATPPLTDRPFDFRAGRSRNQLILNGELPLIRLLERNNYRTALIAYQRERRRLQAAEDQVVLEARTELRQLRVLAENYKIQQRAVPVGYSQRDNSLEQLRIPNPPGSASSAGNAAALTQQLLSAQNIVLRNENSIYQFYVGYLTTRLQLFRDLELMPLDPRGVWIDDHAALDCDGPCHRPAGGAQDGTEPERGGQPERLPEPRAVEPAGPAAPR